MCLFFGFKSFFPSYFGYSRFFLSNLLRGKKISSLSLHSSSKNKRKSVKRNFFLLTFIVYLLYVKHDIYLKCLILLEFVSYPIDLHAKNYYIFIYFIHLPRYRHVLYFQIYSFNDFLDYKLYFSVFIFEDI